LHVFRRAALPSMIAFAALALKAGRARFTGTGGALCGRLGGGSGAAAVAVVVGRGGVDSATGGAAATTNSGERSGCTKRPVMAPTKNAMTIALPPASIHARFGRVLQKSGRWFQSSPISTAGTGAEEAGEGGSRSAGRTDAADCAALDSSVRGALAVGALPCAASAEDAASTGGVASVEGAASSGGGVAVEDAASKTGGVASVEGAGSSTGVASVEIAASTGGVASVEGAASACGVASADGGASAGAAPAVASGGRASSGAAVASGFTDFITRESGWTLSDASAFVATNFSSGR
jgi:hypothetical protein